MSLNPFKRLSRKLREPIRYPGLLLNESERFLKDTFLLQMDTGAILLLERETGPGFLQLAIVEHRDNWRKVEFGLPDAEWSNKQFDLVYTAMEKAGYKTELETNPGNERIPRFLRVYVQDNREELTLTLLKLLGLAATKLEFDMTDRYTLSVEGPLSSEYMDELFTEIEQSPRSGRIGRLLATGLRRLGKRHNR